MLSGMAELGERGRNIPKYKGLALHSCTYHVRFDDYMSGFAVPKSDLHKGLLKRDLRSWNCQTGRNRVSLNGVEPGTLFRHLTGIIWARSSAPVGGSHAIGLSAKGSSFTLGARQAAPFLAWCRAMNNTKTILNILLAVAVLALFITSLCMIHERWRIQQARLEEEKDQQKKDLEWESRPKIGFGAVMEIAAA
jgi:hypothetical protein